LALRLTGGGTTVSAASAIDSALVTGLCLGLLKTMRREHGLPEDPSPK
jgi:hypothetical protein